MKKITILILTILSFSKLHSQITKGNWMVGGVISYSSINYKSENFGDPHIAYSLQIKPNIGYFLADKFAAGIKVGIEKNGVRDTNIPGYNKYTDFNIGPYVRYYFLKPDNNLNILSEGMYQYGFEVGNAHDPSSKNSFAISAGPVIYFNTVVGLEFLISYSTYKFSGVKGSNNTVMFGLGLQVHLENEK